MKTKLLSVFLVLAMLMTSVLCVLSASAVEADYDALAKAEGYVCRVGEPNADFTGYYKFFSAADTGYTEDQPNALVAALGAGNEATITLIDTINVSQEVRNAVNTKFLHTSVAIPGGKTLTINGNGQTYNSKWGFRAAGGNLTVKNLNIVLVSGANEAFGDVRQNGTLTFEDCTMTAQAAIDRSANGFFIHYEPSKMATVNLKNCNISIVGSDKGGAMFWSTDGSKITVNLDNVVFDTSKNPNMAGFNLKGGALNVIGGSDIKAGCNVISNVANVTVTDSKMTSTNASNNGNLFSYNGLGVAVHINVSGNSVLTASNRIMNFINNTQAVNVTIGGQTQLIWQGKAEDNGFYACGKNCDLVLTIKDEVSYQAASGKTAVSVANGGNPLKSFVFNLLDKASVSVPNGTMLYPHTTRTTYNLSDRATFTAKVEYGGNSALTKNHIYTPEMKFGASVRIVPDAENSNGLRFTSMLVNNATPTRYGTLIVKAADLGDTEFTIAALTAANIKFANIAATEEGTVKGDDKTTYNAALVNLPDAEFTTEFAARAYAVYTIDGTEYIVYSDFTAKDNVRSLVNVAEAALNDTESTQSEEYCYKIAEDVYSPYTPAQYEVLKAYAAKKN